MPASVTPRLNCYSLWLMAASESQTQLQGIINTFSESVGSCKFTGHITLITPRIEGDVQKEELMSCGTALANTNAAPVVEFTGIGIRNTYFQSMFLQAVPTQQLCILNLAARGHISQLADAPYMPHLSLLYGEYDWAVKKTLIPQVTSQIQFPHIVTFDRLVLVRAYGLPSEWTIEEQYWFED